jgi:hypothetical protein
MWHPTPTLLSAVGDRLDGIPNFKTSALLALEACRPLKVQVHSSDWARIVTPLRLREWERVLSVHPDQEFAQFVCAGIRDGFRIGFSYRGPSVNPDREI